MTVAARVWKPVEDRPSLRWLLVLATEDEELGTRCSLDGAMLEVEVGLLGGYGDAEAGVLCQLSSRSTDSAIPRARMAAPRRGSRLEADKDMDVDIVRHTPRYIACLIFVRLP